MKVSIFIIVVALCFGIQNQSFAHEKRNEIPSEQSSKSLTEGMVLKTSFEPKPGCLMSITGTGYVEGAGKLRMSFTVIKDTCEEAAAELKKLVLEFQLRIK